MSNEDLIKLNQYINYEDTLNKNYQQEIIKICQRLQQTNIKIKLQLNKSNRCYFCNEYVLRSKQQFTQHFCNQLVHNECLGQQAQLLSDVMDPQILSQIQCINCQGLFSYKQIETCVGIDKINNIRNIIDQQVAYEEEQKLQEQDREENRQAALNKKFNCIICYNDEAKVSDGCYSICDIDEHRFCKECLEGQILADYKKIDIKCSLCLELEEDKRPENYTINIQTIQEILTKEQYNTIIDYWSTYKMKNEKNEKGENVYIQCIGFLKKGYQEGDENMILTQQEQTQIIVHKKLSDQYEIKECPGIIENNKYADNQDNQVCYICKVNFCNLCKNVRHENSTCEQFKQWIQDNAIGDKGLEQIVNNGKFQQCGKCKNIVEKNEGCNHMTCRCGYEFCYICGQDYRKHNINQCKRKEFKV